MAELLLNDPIAFRRCILLEFLSGDTVFDSYRAMCRRSFKGHRIDYPEFEFWYLRFEKKQFDLTYDRSEDPPTRTFYALPPETLQHIVGFLDTDQRIIAAKACKSLRSAVNSCKSTYTYFQVNIHRSFITFHFDDYHYFSGNFFFYSNGLRDEGFDTEMIYGEAIPKKSYNDREKHMIVALRDLKSFLNLPKLELEHFGISQVPEVHLDSLLATFEQLDHKIQSKFVQIRTHRDARELRILQYIDPNFVKKLKLELNYTGSDDDDDDDESRDVPVNNQLIEEMLDLAQCQKVEMIELRIDILKMELFRVETFMKCRRFKLEFSKCGIRITEIMRIINTLLTSSSLELLYLKNRLQFEMESAREEISRNESNVLLAIAQY